MSVCPPTPAWIILSLVHAMGGVVKISCATFLQTIVRRGPGNHVLVFQDIHSVRQAPEPQDAFKRESIGLTDQLDVGGQREGGAGEGADFYSLHCQVDGEVLTLRAATARNAGLRVILQNINHPAVRGCPRGY